MKSFKKVLIILLLILSFSFVACDNNSNNNNNGGNSSQTIDKKYTVTFVSNTDLGDKKTVVKEGEKVSAPSLGTKEGYEFKGWYTEANFVNQYNFDSKVNSNLTLYAKWQKINSNPNPDPVDPVNPVVPTPDDNHTYGIVDNDVAIRTDVEFSKDAHQSANHKVFDCNSFSSGSYAVSYNNAYEKTTINGFSFSCYRYGKESETLKLNAPGQNYDSKAYHGREGAVFNVTPFGGINNFSITYQTSSAKNTAPTKPNVRFGADDNCLDYVYFLDPSTDTNTVNINVNLSMYQYFSINSGDYDTYVASFSVDYDNNSTTARVNEATSGNNKTRINPIRYTYSLVPGESKITAPIEYEYDQATNSYNVTKTKEYTYYTADYVKNHMEVYDDAVLTDPMDVCIYYTLFRTWPANYAEKGNKLNKIQSTFGSDTRQVSEYNRTDGYVRAVPWDYVNVGGYYYELDIDVDGTYKTSSRGVGRVVVWDRGWTEDGYDNSPVCIYTDDHYNTFMEYLNNGTWSKRFNAEGLIASISYSKAQTVTLNGFDAKAVEGKGEVVVPDTPTETPVNDEDYYGNYAPATLINNSTALFQKVTNTSGIVDGNAYVIVNESAQAIYNNYEYLTLNLTDHTISYYEPNSDSHKDLSYIYTFHFEKISGNNYYLYYTYFSDSKYLTAPTGRSEGLVEGKEAVNITFDAYGNMNLCGNNLYLRYNPANNGLWRFYTQGSQKSIQLYRYCDIEGATPEEGGNTGTQEQMIDTGYKLVTSLSEITSKATYLIINPDYNKCLTDLNNGTYKIGDWFEGYPLNVTENASYEKLYFVKHNYSGQDYFGIYVIRDDVKYYLTYKDKNFEFSTTLTTYYFVGVSSDGTCQLSAVCEDQYGDIGHVFDDNNWWFLNYDATNSKFKFTSNIYDSTLYLYKYEIPVEMEETNYKVVSNMDQIVDEQTYLLVVPGTKTCLTDKNEGVYNASSSMLSTSKDAEYEELHFTVHHSSEDYYEIYVLRNDIKYYLTYDKDNNKIIYSTTSTTYFVGYIINNVITIKIAKLAGNDDYHYASPISNEEGCHITIGYDYDNKEIIPLSMMHSYEQLSLFIKLEPVHMNKTNYALVETISEINSTDKYLIADMANNKCLTDSKDVIYNVDDSSDVVYLTHSDDAEYEVLYFEEAEIENTKYYLIYVLRNDVKYYLTVNNYELEYSQAASTYFVIEMYLSGLTELKAYVKDDNNILQLVDKDGVSTILGYDTTNNKFVMTASRDSSVLIFKYQNKEE